MKHLTIALFLTLIAQGNVFASEVYTWKDKSGQVHYSDKPPADVDAKLIRAEAPNTAGSSSADMSKADRAFKERQAKQGDADKKNAEQAARKASKDEACNNLRNRIALFEQGGRIATQEGGERVLLSDEQIASELSKMKAQQDKDCR